ncbi:hypothetical protein M5689_004089 [Euphorbia peplus]|nr:hypothetical protein M5689_004089 [Euphorbia peplus]
MVKPIVKSVICIFCMVILCASVLAQGEEKYCKKQESFPGKCEQEAVPCVSDFIAKYGANVKPKDCDCKDISPAPSTPRPQVITLYSRFCTCQLVC